MNIGQYEAKSTGAGSGRAGRPEYWWFALFYVLCTIVATVIDGVILRSSVLSSLVGLALLLPTFGVTVRRLHDIGRSGWWILINLIPIVGIILMIYWLAQAGTSKANQYA